MIALSVVASVNYFVLFNYPPQLLTICPWGCAFGVKICHYFQKKHLRMQVLFACVLTDIAFHIGRLRAVLFHIRHLCALVLSIFKFCADSICHFAFVWYIYVYLLVAFLEVYL